MSSAIVPSEAAPLTRTPAQAKAELHAARERVMARLEALEKELPSMGKWRDVVRKHPVLTVGGLFVAGYLVGRWLGRR